MCLWKRDIGGGRRRRHTGRERENLLNKQHRTQHVGAIRVPSRAAPPGVVCTCSWCLVGRSGQSCLCCCSRQPVSLFSLSLSTKVLLETRWLNVVCCWRRAQSRSLRGKFLFLFLFGIDSSKCPRVVPEELATSAVLSIPSSFQLLYTQRVYACIL